MCSPVHNIMLHRCMLESALLFSGSSPAELLALSQSLDRLINYTHFVRGGCFKTLPMRAVRHRVRNALP